MTTTTKRCHRIRVNTSILGVDPGMLLVTVLVFVAGCEWVGNPFVALILALLAGSGVQLLRCNRMPGTVKSLYGYFETPERLVSLGRDRVPALPANPSARQRRHHADL